MNTTKATLLGSVAWAVAMLVAALLFKGHRFGTWVEGALYVGFTIYLSSRVARETKCRWWRRGRA